ncbi:MAG: protein kinase [Gemmataceae bacterium]
MIERTVKAMNSPSVWDAEIPLPSGYRAGHLLKRTKRTEIWTALTADERPRAIKLIQLVDPQAMMHDKGVLDGLRNMRHGQLVSIDWISSHRNLLMVVMELAQGSLGDLFDNQLGQFGVPWPASKVCRYLVQAAQALDFLNTCQHPRGGQLVALQHGNLKPSNLLRIGSTVKVTDPKLSSQTNYEQAGDRLLGTLRYAAPEVFHGWVSEHSDQYALAVIYCEFRGGRRPFRDPPAGVDPGYVRPEPDLTMVSEIERDHVARALAVCPHDRWPSCEAFITELSRE